jgi:DNA-binding SARP family transcriptional activator
MEYRVLGPLEVREGDRSLPLAGEKQRALLALLLLNANRVVSRERLIDDLWGDEPPETAVTIVQVYVSRLRKLLPPETLVTQPPGYLLAAEPEQVDLQRFDRLLREGRAALAAGDPERAARRLREGLELWRGPPLAEFASEPFARVEGGRLEELRLSAVEERIEADLALARHGDLIGELEVLTVEHPHRERLRGQLILALYRSGRQAEALEAYRQTRAALDELGIEPDERLRLLERAVLTHDVALDLPPPLVRDPITLPGALKGASPFPFVGRARELATLRSLLALTEEGDGGQVALISGEAGSGKTRLVRELAREAAERGTLVLFGGSDAVVNTPYQPFIEALEFLIRVSDPSALKGCLGTDAGELTRLLPTLPLRIGPLAPPAAGDPETERHRLHSAVVGLFARVSRLRPLLLVIDDVHWADASSLSLLRQLARAIPEGRIMLIATSRERSEDIRPEFVETLAELSRLDGLRRVALAGLSAEQTADFVRRSIGADATSELANALVELTHGTPFLLCELWRALVDAGAIEISDEGARLTRPLVELSSPESVRDVVRYRLSRLSPPTATVLEVAAVAGPQFELNVLRKAAGLEESELISALEQALQSGMIEELAEPTLAHAFTHELVRRALYDRLTRRKRAQLHLSVGEALEEQAGDHVNEVAGVLSVHFFEGSDYEKAWKYAVVAGKRAEAMFANVVAAELYERAIAAATNLPELPASELAGVLESLGDVCELFGAYYRSFIALERARELVGAESALVDARLLGKQGTVHEIVGRLAEAFEACELGLARLDDTEDGHDNDGVRASIELRLGSIHYRQTNNREAILWLEAAALHAERADERGTLGHAYYLLDAAHRDLGSPDGLRYLALARAIYEELGDLRGLGAVLSNLGIHAYYEARWDESLALYRESREVKERAGHVIGAVTQVNNEGEILSDQGRIDEATALFEEMRDVSRASGWAFGEGAALSNLARAAARTGRFQDAHVLFDKALAVFEKLSTEQFKVEAKARRAECLVFEGRYQEALEVVAECGDAAAKSPGTGAEALIERSTGYALQQAGRPEEARPHFEESLRIARELKADYEVALTLRAMAETGYPSKDDLSAQSEAILERLGVIFVPSVPHPNRRVTEARR